MQAAVSAGLITAAHDCSEGGLAVALAEAAVTSREGIGCDVTLLEGLRPDVALFGEGPSRVIVTVERRHTLPFEALMGESAIQWRWIGTTGGDRVRIGQGARGLVNATVDSLAAAWRSGCERHLA